MDVHAKIKRHLVVSASSCVQVFADVADTLGECDFDEAVDVFTCRVDDQFPAFDIRED